MWMYDELETALASRRSEGGLPDYAVERTRTSDLRITSALLYQLSYNGKIGM